MGDLTRNISRHELMCKCHGCDFEIQDHEPVIDVVQDLCNSMAEYAGVNKVRLEITSPARCLNYNREIGSNDQSQHVRANAMDVKIFAGEQQVHPSRIHAYLCERYPHTFGLGMYKTFNHIDTREAPARWIDLS